MNSLSFVGGLPGPTPFFFPMETLWATNGDRQKLWGSLQQLTGDRNGTHLPAYRPYRLKDGLLKPISSGMVGDQQIVGYELTQELGFRTSRAMANPNFGPGGGDFMFFSDYELYLEPVIEKHDLSITNQAVPAINALLNVEMGRGNTVDYIDSDHKTGELWGFYLTQPLNMLAIASQPIIQKELRFFRTRGTLFSNPEVGFFCPQSRQFVAALPAFSMPEDHYFLKRQLAAIS